MFGWGGRACECAQGLADVLIDLADERPLDHLPAADVVRARDRVEQGDEAAASDLVMGRLVRRLERDEDGLRDVRPERLTADELAPVRLYIGHDRHQLSLKLSVERRAGGRPPWAVAPAPAFVLIDLADERPPDHLPAADVVRARDRVEHGDKASGGVRPERLTADELGSARWSAH